MAIAKTKLVNISADLEKMDRVLGRFVELDCIHPVASSQIVDRVHGLTAFTGENPCTQVLTEISEIEQTFDFPIKDTTIDEVQETLESMRSFVSGVHSKLVTMTVQKKNELELVHKYQDALIQIQNIESLDISLDDVFSCDYISSRVGRLPTDSVEKLRFYRNRPFIFKSFSMDRNYSWCMYFTTSEFEREVDNIFSSLFFERIHIPDFVHGTPEAAEVNLENEIEFATSQMERTKVQIYTYLNEVEDRLIQTKAGLKLLEKVYEAKQYVVGMGGKFTITGFIEPTDEAILREKFHDIPGVEISIRPASSDMRLKPPTKLKEGWFSRPFTFFVEMYGLPSYGDIDPTPFVAISYSLLFGIMFGDFGQGLLLSLIGWLFARKGMKLGQVGLRIGLSSAFFGLLFGSLFGNEEILASLYTKIGITFLPIHVMNADFTMTLLLLAISLGALLIITSLSINIYLQYKKKKYVEMVLSHNGFAGLLFYLYFLGGLLLKLVFTINIFTTIPLILGIAIPLLLIFFKEPIERKLHKKKMFPSGFGGFFVEGFFELFEVVLSYVSNTMSFMRVGGFVLSHAGMMLVVYTLMGMVPAGVASTIVFLIGNLFVMGLEGLIVGIQVLRLEFYEMFSRYYEGDGVPFTSLKKEHKD